MGTSCAYALTSYRSESERPTEANASGQLQGAQARAATSAPKSFTLAFQMMAQGVFGHAKTILATTTPRNHWPRRIAQLAAKKKQSNGSSREADVVGFIVNEARVAHRYYRNRDLRRRCDHMARCDRQWNARPDAAKHKSDSRFSRHW